MSFGPTEAPFQQPIDDPMVADNLALIGEVYRKHLAARGVAPYIFVVDVLSPLGYRFLRTIMVPAEAERTVWAASQPGAGTVEVIALDPEEAHRLFKDNVDPIFAQASRNDPLKPGAIRVVTIGPEGNRFGQLSGETVFAAPTAPSSKAPWADQLRKSTRLIVAGMRLRRDPLDPMIRADVTRAAREALGIAPASSMERTVLMPANGGSTLAPEKTLNAAGVFRMVIVQSGLDYHDAMIAESIMAVVQSVLDEEFPRKKPR